MIFEADPFAGASRRSNSSAAASHRPVSPGDRTKGRTAALHNACRRRERPRATTRRADCEPSPAHRPGKHRAKQHHQTFGLSTVSVSFDLCPQHSHADERREENSDKPRGEKCDGDDDEETMGVFACALALKPIGRKPVTVNKCAGQHWERRGTYRQRSRQRLPYRRLRAWIPSSRTVIIASSTRSPNAIISAPSEMRCSEMPNMLRTTKTIASTSGIETETTRPARAPSLKKLTSSTMTIASSSAS